jgi:hypothetical protein
MSAPPRKPPGPPPAMPPNGAGIKITAGLGETETSGKKAPGPPPGAPAVAFKPPPTAPPPRTLLPVDRPGVDSIKAIDASRIAAAPPPRGLPPGAAGGAGAPPMPMGIPPRGAPPPRALVGDFKPTEYQAEGPVVVSNGNGKSGHVNGGAAVAGDKSSKVGGASRKQGAISMFDEPGAPQEPADKKSRGSDKPFSPGTLGGPKPGPPVRAEGPTADPTGGFKRPAPPAIQPAKRHRPA